MTTNVRYFTSSLTNAPTCTNAAGQLIAILDAALINGFNSITLDSLVVSSGIATATVSAGHGFANTFTEPVIAIAGATPSGLNGTYKCVVTSTTVFTFETAESDGTATGTITAKYAPAPNWEKSYSNTNKAVYKSTTIGTSGTYIRVEDSTTAYAAVAMYTGMTDVDTGVNVTSAACYCLKSNSSTARTWTLAADDRAFHFFIQNAGTTYNGGFSFGDMISFMPSDPNTAFLIGSATTGGTSQQSSLDVTTGHHLASQYTGTPTTTFRKITHKNVSGGFLGTSSITNLENPPDSRTYILPIEIWESATVVRGLMPGLFTPLPSFATVGQGTLDTFGAGVHAGRTAICHQIGGNSGYGGYIIVDGAWR